MLGRRFDGNACVEIFTRTSIDNNTNGSSSRFHRKKFHFGVGISLFPMKIFLLSDETWSRSKRKQNTQLDPARGMLDPVNVHVKLMSCCDEKIFNDKTNQVLTTTESFPPLTMLALCEWIWIVQRILDDFELQVDEYERRFGPSDRSEFDGEFIVPAEVRNRMNSSKGSLRIHGGLLTISRSRTLLSLSSGGRSSIHSSTPDLSRSVPNTPGSNHKLSLTSSYDSVLEENEDDGVMIIKKGKGKDKKKNGKSYHSSVQHIFANNTNSSHMRRKSEDLLESRASTSSSNASMMVVQKQQNHVRQSSDQAFRLIPRVKKSGFMDGFMNRSNGQSANVRETTNFTASTSKSTAALNTATVIEHDTSPNQWGQVRGSNSFAADLNISSLSTYSIPRVSLSQHRMPLNETSNTHQGAPRKSLPENRVASTFIMRHDSGDSAA